MLQIENLISEIILNNHFLNALDSKMLKLMYKG